MIKFWKFFFKVYVVHGLRTLLLLSLGAPAQQENWDKRLLIINLEAIGDIVVFTSVLKHYKQAFPDKKIYFLIKDGLDLAPLIKPFVDEVLTINYRRFSVNPWHGMKKINQWRRIGFATVLNHDVSPAEILGKMIAVSCQAQTVIGYEGVGLFFQKPFDWNMKKNIEFAEQRLYSKFSTIVPSIDRHEKLKPPYRNVIEHHQILYEAVTGRKETDYAPTLFIHDSLREKVALWRKEHNLEANRYAVFVLGSSMAYKNWPVERFVELANDLKEKGLSIVLVGTKNEASLGEKFCALYDGPVVNAIGLIPIPEITSLIADSLLLISNDTGPVHIAVALKKPLMCLLGTGLVGMISLYGHRDIHRWVYSDRSCFGDNWQCLSEIREGDPAPCITAIAVPQAREVLRLLMEYLEKNQLLSRKSFQNRF